MKRVAVIGANGFVGSAITRHLAAVDVDVAAVTRDNYDLMSGRPSDVVIDAAGNSVKYLADRDPVGEFDQSVAHRLRTLRDFPAAMHVHISSVDVYASLESPETTREDAPIDITRTSNYGMHKYIAEQLVQHYSRRWLIVRLAGMVGAGLRKNPVFDIMTGAPLRIHPDSQYQFLPTSVVASMVWSLVDRGFENEILNVAGSGLVSPRRVAEIAGRDMDLTQLPADAAPRIVDVSIEKIQRIAAMPRTEETVRAFVMQSEIAPVPR